MENKEPLEESIIKEIEISKEEIKRIERREAKEKEIEKSLESWIPKTALGKAVKSGKLKDFDEILFSNKRILEPQIADALLKLDSDLLSIGQAKGKFGGGKRRAWRQTQKKTQEGNIIAFSSMAVVGDRKGHVGLGYGRAKETLPAREKALRKAKLNLIKIKLGFENPDAENKGNEPHTIPFIVEGKSGSSRIKLMPAPRGTGLVISDEGKKILALAGIKDIYSTTKGQTRTTFNLAKAIIGALKKTNNQILGLKIEETKSSKYRK